MKKVLMLAVVATLSVSGFSVANAADVSGPNSVISSADGNNALGFDNNSASSNDISPAIMAVDNSIALGFNEDLMNYQENINPGPSDTESGWMPGFKIAGSYLGEYSHVYVGLSYQYNKGNIHYLGASLDTGAPVQTTDRATTQRLMAKVGYAFTPMRDVTVIPYVAGGFQNWNRNLKIAYGTEIENYNAGLVGAGALIQYQAMPRLVLSADTEILAVVGGTMHPNFSGLDFGNAKFETSGEEKIGLSANYQLTGPWSVYGGLDFTHYNYTGGILSNTDGEAYEPSSSTNQFGINAGVRYSFS